MTVTLPNKRRNPFANIGTDELIELRRRCEARGPGCLGAGQQAHHGLVRRDRRFAKQLDVLINFQCVCWVCHTGTGYADSKENHEKFEAMQRERYGDDVDLFFEMLRSAGMYV